MHNEAQGGWVLLAPERVFKADAIAVEILKRCAGEATFADDRRRLAATFARRASGSRRRRARCCAGWRTSGCWSYERACRQRHWPATGHLPPAARPARRADPSLPARLPLLLQSARARCAARTNSTPRPGRGCSREAAALGVLQVHLSGGEPGARRDLVEIAAAAHAAGLYTNLITSGVGITDADAARRSPRPGSTTCRSRSRTASAASADHIAGYNGAFARKLALAAEVVRLGLPLTVNAVMHRANIDRIGEMVDLALALGARRVEIAHAQYYGWALKNRAALMPTARAGRARGRAGRGAARAPSGRIVIDAVVPDYYARYPEALRGRLGPALAQRHAGRQGAALPRRRDDPGPRVLVRARAFARRHLGAFAGLQSLPRHRLDAGAVPELRRREIDFGGCRCQAFALTGDAARDRSGLPSLARHDRSARSRRCRPSALRYRRYQRAAMHDARCIPSGHKP